MKKVTQLAYNQIRTWGFSEVIGNISFPEDDNEFRMKPFSKKLSTTIDYVSILFNVQLFHKG